MSQIWARYILVKECPRLGPVFHGWLLRAEMFTTCALLFFSNITSITCDMPSKEQTLASGSKKFRCFSFLFGCLTFSFRISLSDMPWKLDPNVFISSRIYVTACFNYYSVSAIRTMPRGGMTLGNTSPKDREISWGRGFCTQKPNRLPKGKARGQYRGPRGAIFPNT